MNKYLVRLSWDDPYPKEWPNRDGEIAEGNLSSAIGKVVRKFRKENKGRRIKEIRIRAIRL
jgi:hypothetical protein